MKLRKVHFRPDIAPKRDQFFPSLTGPQAQWAPRKGLSSRDRKGVVMVVFCRSPTVGAATFIPQQVGKPAHIGIGKNQLARRRLAAAATGVRSTRTTSELGSSSGIASTTGSQMLFPETATMP
jgi:hypothetical protein